MDAIELLMNEHRQIEAVLDALEGRVGALEDGGAIEPAEMGAYVRFIREYADGLHHAKEEDILFRAMIDSGFPVQGGPLGVMLAEHEEGRRFVARMAGLAALPAPLARGDMNRFAAAALGYVELLRHHIFKEDNIVYSIARMQLDAASLARVDAACERFQAAHPEVAELLTLARSFSA